MYLLHCKSNSINFEEEGLLYLLPCIQFMCIVHFFQNCLIDSAISLFIDIRKAKELHAFLYSLSHFQVSDTEIIGFFQIF